MLLSILADVDLGYLATYHQESAVAVGCCHWLSRQIGQQVRLPTQAQWEYACRAGSADPLSYGDVDTDFSKLANMADATIRELAYDTDGRHTADLVARDNRCDDDALVTAVVGSYRPNAWGLYDMHGNVWEWTRSAYRRYPYVADDGRNGTTGDEPVAVRGGSWRDRPKRCRSAFRSSYPAWQRVLNIGFRVVFRTPEKGEAVVLAGDKQYPKQVCARCLPLR